MSLLKMTPSYVFSNAPNMWRLLASSTIYREQRASKATFSIATRMLRLLELATRAFLGIVERFP